MNIKKHSIFIALIMIVFFMGTSHVNALGIEKRKVYRPDDEVLGNTGTEEDSSDSTASDDDSSSSGTSDGTTETGDVNIDCDAFGYTDEDTGEFVSFFDILDTAYAVMRIAAVILMLILGMTDFGKAIFSNDQDLMKKASQKFVKRLVIMVIILILPFIIDPIVKMALGDGYDTCGVGSDS